MSNSSPKQKAKPARRNALPRGVIGEVAMPTQRDITWLGKQRLPLPTDKRVRRDLQQVFTLEVRSTLEKPDVVRFLGVRVAPEKLGPLALEAQRAEAVRVRMEHGAEISARIALPLQAELYEGVARLMRDWDDFAAQFPQAADRLSPLREWWEEAHPSTGGRPAHNDESAHDDKPAHNDKPAPTPAPIPKPAG